MGRANSVDCYPDKLGPMALEIGFGQSHEIALGHVPNPDPLRLKLTFDDFDRALPYQGYDQVWVIG